MTIEIKLLLAAILLGLAHIVAMVLVLIYEQGLKYAMSARDEQRPLGLKAARLERAYQNFVHTFPFFAVPVLIAAIMNVHNLPTIYGSELYFCCRVIYIFAYVFAIPLLRTLIWAGSIAGIVMVIAGVGDSFLTYDMQ